MSGDLIVGFGGSVHDYATCLIEGDQILVAIEDERLTRVRYSLNSTNPLFPSYSYCLAKVPKRRVSSIRVAANDMLPETLVASFNHPVTWISHHASHAYHAYLTSTFHNDTAILVADGAGSVVDHGGGWHARETVSWFLARHDELQLLKRSAGLRTSDAVTNDMATVTADSIGDLYKLVTRTLGYSDLQAGKTMALSAFGSERFIDFFSRFISIRPHGEFNIDAAGLATALVALTNSNHFEADFRFRVDLAKAVQHYTELLVLHCLEYLHESTGAKALCFSGGVALNSVVNGKIAKQGFFDNVYIPSAPGDGGTAIGAATYAAISLKLVNAGTRWTSSPFLGAPPDSLQIEALKRTHHTATFGSVHEMINTVADLLADGYIVGWFRGGSEFGPRALGHRSILASPLVPYIRERLNATIKFREWFRPIAPVILAEDSAEYFEAPFHSSMMQFVFPVKAKWQERLASIIHADGSARAQTLASGEEPIFYELIRAFEARTGVPILLNTSLNSKGEPIVESPLEAIALFDSLPLDAMVIQDNLFLKGG